MYFPTIRFATQIVKVRELVFVTIASLTTIFSRSGEWGDHVTLQAAADKVNILLPCYNSTIICLASSHNLPWDCKISNHLYILYRWHPLESLTLFLSTCKLSTSYRNPLYQASPIHQDHLFMSSTDFLQKNVAMQSPQCKLSNFTLKFCLRNPAATRGVSPSYTSMQITTIIFVSY